MESARSGCAGQPTWQGQGSDTTEPIPDETTRGVRGSQSGTNQKENEMDAYFVVEAGSKTFFCHQILDAMNEKTGAAMPFAMIPFAIDTELKVYKNIRITEYVSYIPDKIQSRISDALKSELASAMSGQLRDQIAAGGKIDLTRLPPPPGGKIIRGQM